MSLDVVHRFIERLDRDPKAREAFQTDRRAAMEIAGLSPAEAELLELGSRDALDQLGVLKLLQIRYFLARFPERGSFMSVKDWADRLPLASADTGRVHG
jgi:hypothetical protein